MFWSCFGRSAQMCLFSPLGCRVEARPVGPNWFPLTKKRPKSASLRLSPKLERFVAKVGLAKEGCGQRRLWPNKVVAKVFLAKVGQSRFGRGRGGFGRGRVRERGGRGGFGLEGVERGWRKIWMKVSLDEFVFQLDESVPNHQKKVPVQLLFCDRLLPLGQNRWFPLASFLDWLAVLPDPLSSSSDHASCWPNFCRPIHQTFTQFEKITRHQKL